MKDFVWQSIENLSYFNLRLARRSEVTAIVVEVEDLSVLELYHPRHPHLRIFPSDKHGMRGASARVVRIVPFADDHLALHVDYVDDSTVDRVSRHVDLPVFY